MDNAKNTAQIKQSNIRLIRGSLLKGKSLTKKEISDNTGLSLATCTVILAELIETNQVTELELAAPNGGRPARRFSINPDFAHILCLYTDNNAPVPGIRSRVYDIKGTILYEEFKEAAVIAAGNIRSVIGDILLHFPKIKMIGLGIAGITDDNDIIEVSDFTELIGVNLKGLIENEFGVKTIVENDLYFTSYGFYFLSGRIKPFSLSVSIWPEKRCAGAGSIVDGHILLGSTRFAGEISNLPYPVSKEQQREMLRNNEDITMFVATYLVCNITIINPDVMYITGRSCKMLSISKLKEICSAFIPERHLPEFYLQMDISEEYMTGIFELTKEKLDFKN